MNLRGKIFHKKNKRVYKVLNIDFFNNKIDVVDGNTHTTFDFKDTVFLESTGMKGNKGYIYKSDFLTLVIGKNRVQGVVIRDKGGHFYLRDKKRKEDLHLKVLVENASKIINLGNSTIFFDKLKSKKK
ncbi:MAG: hypothetical protein Q4A58_04025 [Fusobacterium sp.]|uniref:hypothetical protein n=1 Tax=Fusobacterium sp. TaxID=68766 RepID=UPI0026DAEE5F|nr:hypothetical protein [Fusobacterium sp.]MDO4690446.1 hypothetical protein [Fusobacterium sp.]